MKTKTMSICIPENWVLKLKKKAIKRIEVTGKHTTVSQLVIDALQEKYFFKIEGDEK
jgi:hypothetical protein